MPDSLTERGDSFQQSKRLRQSISTNSGSLEQLYRGEKARNQLLQKKVSDLQAKLHTQREQLVEALALRRQNKEFRELILKYEEQQIIKDQELEAMQLAIKDSVANVEEANEGLIAELNGIKVENEELVAVNAELNAKCHGLHQLEQEYLRIQMDGQAWEGNLQQMRAQHDLELENMKHQFEQQSEQSQLNFERQMEELKMAFQMEAKDSQERLEKKDREMQQLLRQRSNFESQLNELELAVQRTMNEKSEKLAQEKKQMNQKIE